MRATYTDRCCRAVVPSAGVMERIAGSAGRAERVDLIGSSRV